MHEINQLITIACFLHLEKWRIFKGQSKFHFHADEQIGKADAEIREFLLMCCILQ